MFVAVQLSLPGLYLPPVFKSWVLSFPPQIIISLSVQTAVWPDRSVGALAVLVAVQVLLLGLYLPPVFKGLTPSYPPHTIISPLVHTAV